MTEALINEWLNDYGALSPVEIHSFATNLEHDFDLVNALYNVLEERSRFQELIDPVCKQLLGFYRSREVQLQRFTLQFLPTLIFVYLNSVAHGDKRSCRNVETLLISLYNLEVIDEHGQPKVVSFRLPSLAQDSIYHEKTSLAHASLTESALRRFEECNTKLVNWGPLPQIDVLNAQNRLKVMTALLFVYNQQLSLLHKSALEQLCKVCSKLVTQGFNKPGHHQRSSYGSDSSFVPRVLPRIPMSTQFLLECLHGIYFAMFNGCSYVATQALEDIYNRGCHEGYAEVVLVTRAIRKSPHVNISGQPNDGPMGISMALSSATTTVPTVSKSMITNASFRTKKLPDDIPIQATKEDGSGDTKNLVSIIEEQEEPEKTTPRGNSIRSKDAGKKLPNFSGIGKKVKEIKGPGKSSPSGQEKKEINNDNKKISQLMKQESNKSLVNKGSLFSMVMNGGDSSHTEADSPVGSRKKSNLSDVANGPISLDSAINIEVVNQEDLTDLSESQSCMSTDSVELPTGIENGKMSDLQNVPCKGMEVENRSALQVSSV